MPKPSRASPAPISVNVSFPFGAGDILMSLYGLDNPSAAIISLVRRRPRYTFRAVICTHCASVPSLFDHNPYFTEIEVLPWPGDADLRREQARAGRPYLDELIDGDWPLERMPFFLSPYQQRIFDRITRKPYLALHLFAGGDDRSWFASIGHHGAARILAALADSGWPVVLLGGNSKREDAGRVTLLHESLQTPARLNGIVNLLGIGGLKLHAALAAHAAAVLGGMSCFVSLATKFDRPLFVMAPRYQKRIFRASKGGHCVDGPPDTLGERELIAKIVQLGQARFLEETSVDQQIAALSRFLARLR